MVLHNLRYGLRQLRKNPGFTTIAILTLTLGIGMTGAMFTVVYSVLLQPMPFANPEQVVTIGQASQSDNHPGVSSLPNIRYWREQSRSFHDIAYWNHSVHTIKKGEKAELVADIRCSANLFSFLGIQPMLGRAFYPHEDLSGEGNVAVLSATLWKGLFLSDPDIIGRNIEIGADYYTVIGVMPDAFIFPLTQNSAMVWIPIQPKKEWEDRDTAMLEVVGRLNGSISIGAAQDELTAITKSGSGSKNVDRARVLVEDYRQSITGDIRASLLLLETAALAVYLIACVNIVSLLLARATSRRRETAIRCALGANQRNLLSQFFTESAILGGLSGLLGLLLCYGFLWVLRPQLQYKLPFADTIHVNLSVVAVITFMSVVSTLLVGIWPVIQSRWASPQEALHEGSAAAGSSRRQRAVQNSLVVCEVALSMVLLLSGGLLLRTLYNLRSTPLGFVPDHLIVAQLLFSRPDQGGREVISSVYEPLLQNLEKVPGVESAAISTILPMDANSSVKIAVQIFGRPNQSKQASTAELRIVSPELYRTLGIRLLSGRLFTNTDTQSAPRVVVVNQTFVRKYLPDVEPLGQQVRTAGSGPHKFSSIVGVVEDTHQRSIAEVVAPEIDLCYRQLVPTDEDDFAYILGMIIQVAVRTKTDPTSVIPSIRAVLQPINPEVPANISTMQNIVDRSLSSQILAARLIGIFAACALLIAIIGLYGLLAYNVSRSTRDIAVRLALGATRSNVLAIVMRQAALLLGIGIAIGLVISIQTARLIRSYLYGVGTHDAYKICEDTVR